jgi:hypothetical protein
MPTTMPAPLVLITPSQLMSMRSLLIETPMS